MVTSRPRRGRSTTLGFLLALALLSGAAWLFHPARPAGAAPAQSANATFVRRVSLPSNDLVYDGVSKMLYASVPSSAGSGGNSITPVNPATGAVGTPVFVGSEPGRLALSDDGRYLYTFLEGATAIRRFDLTTQTPGLQFALRISPTSAPYSPFDFAVLPGSPESLAVSGASTVAVYDNDVRRSSAVNSIYNSPYIEFSTAADTLYGVGGGPGSSPSLYKISVTSGGAALASTTAITGGGDFRVAAGRIYLPSGHVYDAATGALQGTFPDLSGYGGTAVRPDPASGRVYFVVPTWGITPTLTLRAYDINTFTLLGSAQMSGYNSTVTSLVRWGANGLAFRTSGSYGTPGGELYVVQTSLIPSAEPVPTPTPSPTPYVSPTPTPTPVTFIRRLALPANDLVYDPGRQRLYASVPSLAGAAGNTVTAVDPVSGALDASTFVGSEPNKMALTDDGQHLYVGLDGAGAVRRFDPATNTAGLQFSLGGSTYDGPYYPRDLATLAGQPDLVAVARGVGQSYYSLSIAVYDGGTQRPTTAVGGDALESSGKPSTLYGSGSFQDFQRLSVNSSGVTASGTIYGGGSTGDFRVAAETIYSRYGKAIDAETGTLKGTFAGISGSSWAPLVVPDPGHGRVFFLTSNGAGGATLRAYDINTFLLLGTLDIPSVTGTPAALVRWGADGLAFRTTGGTSYDSAMTAAGQVFLIQTTLASGAAPTAPPPVPTPTPTPTPLAPVVDVSQLTLATNDLVYEPTRKLLYASVPGSAGAGGNSVTPVDPAAETVGTAVFVGSEPKRLALSDDAQYLYVGLDGAGAVRRFDLTSNTAGLQFSLGSSQFSGPYRALDLAPLPGQPASVAVARTVSGGVVVYDNDTQRPNAATHNSPNYIEFAGAADTLYGSGASNTLVKMSLDAQGATHVSSTPVGAGGDFRMAGGRVYMPTGQVVEAATGHLVGKFSGLSPYNNLVAPDPANGRVYFLTGTDYYGGHAPVTLTLRAFDIETFRPVGSVQVPGVATPPTSLVRWGARGLAFRTGPNSYTGPGAPPGNQIFLVRTSLVPSDEVIPTKTKFSLASYTVYEYGQSAAISVTRSGDNSAPATVNYSTSNGTATAGQDYAAASGTLTFAAGETSKTFNVTVINDNTYEGPETVNLTLSNPAGASLAQPSQATLTIYDDDSRPFVSVYSQSITEPDVGTADMNISVVLSNPSAENVTVSYATSGGTATSGSDFLAASGTVTIPAGSTSSTVAVKVVGDYVVEPNETFYLNISNPVNAYLGYGAQGAYTIINNDAPGALAFGARSYGVSEGDGSVVVTVNRHGGMSAGVTVNYSTSDGTATAGQDYAATSGTLTFAGGETSKTFNVPIINDAIWEGDETIALSLSGVTGGANYGTPSAATVTIRDDDPAPSLSISDVTVAEGSAGPTAVTFTVTLSAVSGQAVTVNFATADGTATGGFDYAPASGMLIIPAGSASAAITIEALGDTANEPDETFFVNLSGATNATVSDAQGVATILNDDTPLLQFSRDSFPVGEGAHFVTVTVIRSGDPSAPVAVAYATSDATATERDDYTAALGTLRFAAGEVSKGFDVLITDDAHPEQDETVNLALSNPSGGALLGIQHTAAVVISGDDPPSAPNPIDASEAFVRQHYADFLNRVPDAAGLAFWTNAIESCGADAQCRELNRINVSAAFFLSIEFQQTGYFVYRLNQAAFNTQERLRWHAFLADTQEIGRGVQVGVGDWEAKLESNKQAFAAEFAARPEFASSFQAMTSAQYVDALNANTYDPLAPGLGAALSQAERDQLVSDLEQSRKTRAEVLRVVAEHPEFARRQFNRAFVLMQYFGYLRRNPNEGPDSDYAGYEFWLGNLNHFNGNFIQAELVKAFISSAEYRRRFGR